jgi:hypothetical protein
VGTAKLGVWFDLQNKGLFRIGGWRCRRSCLRSREAEKLLGEFHRTEYLENLRGKTITFKINSCVSILSRDVLHVNIIDVIWRISL